MTFENAEQAREFLFTVIESLPNGIILADGVGQVVAINAKGADILGVRGVAVQSLSCWEILKSGLGLQQGEIDGLQNAGGRMFCETAAGERGAAKRYLSIARTELKSPFWQISGFFISLEDVTYLSMVAAQFDRQKRLDAMREMAAGMSQELKNPLGSIALYASILKRELGSDPDNERVAGQMQHAVQSMDCILNNYVTFAHLPAPQLAVIEINEWLNDALGIVELMGRGKIDFVRCFKHQDGIVFGDRVLLKQLVLNLCINALESMSGVGKIFIETATVSPEGHNASLLEVRIRDEGEGIPAENLAKVFDPFFSTRGCTGGLGLATAHYIADVHKGLISVDSIPGKGSVFTVLLPIEERDGRGAGDGGQEL